MNLTKIKTKSQTVYINPDQVTYIRPTDEGTRVHFSSGEWIEINWPPEEVVGVIFLADGESADGGPGVRLRTREKDSLCKDARFGVITFKE